MTVLGDLILEAKPGFACGAEDTGGVFQFRMHNVTKNGDPDLAKRRRVPKDVHKKIESFLLEPRDVLFNSTNSPDNVGKAVLVPEINEPAVFSNHFVRLRPDKARLDAEYLWRWLQLRFRQGIFGGMCRQWVNQATVGRGDLLALNLEVPPIEEQRRIAAILDQADTIVTRQREVLCLLDGLTSSTFEDMFSGQAAMTTVENLATTIRTGPFGSQLLHSEFVEEGIAVLGLDNVVGNDFRWAERRYITQEKYEKLQRYKIHAGDVLVSIMGTTGRCVVVPDDVPTAINTKHLCAITVDRTRLEPEFLRAAFLHHPQSRTHLHRQTKGSIMDGLNMGIIKSMPVPLPPLERQRRFTNRIKEISARRAVARRRLATTEELFASLQTRAFRGEL